MCPYSIYAALLKNIKSNWHKILSKSCFRYLNELIYNQIFKNFNIHVSCNNKRESKNSPSIPEITTDLSLKIRITIVLPLWGSSENERYVLIIENSTDAIRTHLVLITGTFKYDLWIIYNFWGIMKRIRYFLSECQLIL